MQYRRSGGAGQASGAEFDASGTYRYRLWRRWGTGPSVAFVMLNPSTADAARNDPTIRRCIGFAQDWGFSELIVVNLYAYRATRPRELFSAPDPVGPANDRHIDLARRAVDLIVVAWGHRGRAERVEGVLSLLGDRPVFCLGRTEQGAPRHPLYTRRDTALRPYARSC